MRILKNRNCFLGGMVFCVNVDDLVVSKDVFVKSLSNIRKPFYVVNNVIESNITNRISVGVEILGENVDTFPVSQLVDLISEDIDYCTKHVLRKI